ncbi:peptidoglycan DD-metalloendopeptidase family protein [Aureibaculum sp. 2210JD6-5]|uniref:peptidoglycan DD-metalloendopeptidase family protein n=1 Tax=Aureibaculum sp. 2210JD6-5 TaxID=3103957 RepID=UPI002AAEB830|nr:peptidoglycan DD-metalloendopeptidase family protein [Aureibaculum sp. 2210JD6-5]MDY7396503.1 peptidoglycan DD-metalloendopeptidase family protein [Aureibaculum sp. 2210JD6-5]
MENELIPEKVEIPELIQKFGYTLNNYKVIEDTIRNGDSFGEILDRHHVNHTEVYNIVEAIKDSFDIAKLMVGKPYVILAKKDTTEKAQVFVYHPRITEYVVIDFTDSISYKFKEKKIKTVIKSASGKITSSLSEAMDEKGLDYALVNEMSDIYAWTVDFFHLQKQDKFKVIYEEKFIDDTIYAGLGEIKAAYFEHKNQPFYAFNYTTDSTKNVSDYYDETANSLRRQFLKAPLQFSRISSRYNLKRFIRYYGRIKPHRGTDFAARVGTPIMSTANGTVTESARRGGNGNYVKIKHNSVYSTQYLHMSKRAVKRGDFVKQGDVIGYVGMTGNTSGPHVCYRFWKNGKQVDPLKQKLPSAEPIADSLKTNYLAFIKPYKAELDDLKVD